MCDLIVAADDARFSNPVLRMTGAGVELLVEPWELGPAQGEGVPALRERRCRAEQAERFGLVNRVVPRGRPRARPRAAMADKVALVPPVTAQAVKDTINHMVDLMGQRESWRYHFMVHQFVSATPQTAKGSTQQQRAGGMDRA